MDNSMAARPYSALKGDPWRAYEALPEAVRLALQEALVDWCPLRAREWHRQLLEERGLRPAQAAAVMVQAIRRHDQAEVAAFARAWPKGAAAYPHLAAGATQQRYAGMAGMPAAQPILLPPAPKRAPPKPEPAPKRSRAKAPRPKPRRAKGRRGRR